MSNRACSSATNCLESPAVPVCILTIALQKTKFLVGPAIIEQGVDSL